MEYRFLGNSDRQVSRLGFGCVAAGGHDYGAIDENAWRLAVRAALDAGINLFDVADVYGFGRAEELLADALGPDRHNVIIATKGGLARDASGRVTRNGSREQMLQAVEASLRRLRVDSLSLYQVHWPDPEVALDQTLEALRQAQQQGKIRYIGVSNFSLSLLRRAAECCRLESQQVAYNLLARDVEDEMLPWCAQHQVSVLAHTPLARGLLAGKRTLGASFAGSDTRVRSPYFSLDGAEEKSRLLEAMAVIAQRDGCSLSAVALRWILERQEITSVLVGVKTAAQLAENLAAVDRRLDPQDRATLSRLSSLCPQGLAGTPAHAGAAGQ